MPRVEVAVHLRLEIGVPLLRVAGWIAIRQVDAAMLALALRAILDLINGILPAYQNVGWEVLMRFGHTILKLIGLRRVHLLTLIGIAIRLMTLLGRKLNTAAA